MQMKIFCFSFIHFATLIYFLHQTHSQLVKKAPPFFSSFKCSPGFMTSGATRNFTCTTPSVIPRVYRYGAAAHDFVKDPSDQVQVVVTLYPVSPTNVTSIVIGLQSQCLFNVEISYFIIAIGDQPENDWVDLLPIYVPQNPASNTLLGGEGSSRSLAWLYLASNFIRFPDLTAVTILTFITSMKTLTYSGSVNINVQISAWAVNSTHFRGQLTASSFVACKVFVGFFFFYKASQITTEAGFYKHDSFTLSQNADNFLDFIIRYPAWGPSFNTKCFFGYWDTTYHRDEDVKFKFLATVKGNFYRFTNSAVNTSNTMFKGAIFCLAGNEMQCGENSSFYDSKTGLCYTASGCPVTTPDPGNVPPKPQLCKLCVGDECIDCKNSNRTNCLVCNITMHSQAINGSCVCVVGYYRPLTICKANCSYHITGCLLASCTSLTYCTQCAVGYYLDLVSSTVQNCLKCSDTISFCQQCYLPGFCSLMCQPLCSKCDVLYGVTAAGQCDLCSTLISHCVQCTDYTACTKCQSNNLTYQHGGICLKCTEIDLQCNGCVYNGYGITCNSCQQGYYLDPVYNVCILCSSTIQDCDTCLFNIYTGRVECTLCLPIFLVDDNFTCNKCKEFEYITGTCSNITGCLSSHIVNGIVMCTSCDAALHFIYNTTTNICQCQSGFILNSIQKTCTQVCGDGIKQAMQCDDGNNINEDGCSSACQIETNFQCQQNNQGTSVCTLVQNITIVYDYMLRHLDQNKVSLYFTVTPPSTALNKVDWLDTITFNFSQPINLQVSYQNGILIVTLLYTSDIQDKILNLDISFNSTLIKSQPQNFSLKMKAINGPLSYSESFASFKTFKYTGLVIGIICLLFYLISSYFHKMIGLQTIQFIQLIYFSRLICQNANQSSFYGLNSLKYSNGYNEITSGHTSLQTYKSLEPQFVRLQLSLYFLDNCNLMLIPIGFASIGYVCYSLKRSYHRAMFIQKNERVHQDKYTISSRKVSLFYDNLIFAFTLSLMYVVFFSSVIYLKSNQTLFISSTSDTFRMSSLGMNLLILFYISGIYCFEFIQGVKRYLQMTNPNTVNVQSQQKSIQHDTNKIGNGFHPLYVSVYLLYQLLLIVVMNLIFTEFVFINQTLLGVSGLYLGLIIYWRPYQLNFHNYAIIANQITVVFFVALLTLLKYKIVNTSFLTVTISITLIFISISTVLQILRLYLHRKLQQKSSQQYLLEHTLKSNKDKLKALLNQNNPFLIQNQINTYQQKTYAQIPKNIFGKYHVQNHTQNYKKFFLNKKNLTIKVNNLNTPKNINSLSIKTINSKIQQKQQQKDFFQCGEQQQQDSYLQELQQVKQKLRNQLIQGDQ